MNIGVVAVLCVGAIYASYALGFYPYYVTIACLGYLAFAAFSRPPAKRPPFSNRLGD